MSPTERLALALEASHWLRELALSGIRLRHPGATESEVLRLYARLTLPPALYRGLYPGTE